jgi:hypothetical protein
MNETYSIQVKRGEPNFGSSSIQIDGIPFGTSEKELDKLVKEALNGMHQARQTLINYEPPKEKKAPCPFAATASRIVTDWTPEQKREFREVCIRAERDSIETVCLAQEEGCTSYDEFILYAADKTKPKNAKPRLEVAQ